MHRVSQVKWQKHAGQGVGASRLVQDLRIHKSQLPDRAGSKSNCLGRA